MIERARRGPYDELKTPTWVLDYILPHVPENWVLWESAPGWECELVQGIADRDFGVVAIEDDYFEATPWKHDTAWDMQLTNPPFSIKKKWLERAEDLGMPWALLLPVFTFGVRGCHEYLEDAEVVFLPRRVDFTGGGAPWHACAWFTKGLDIGKQLVFPDA
jgi:hypothetical protein